MYLINLLYISFHGIINFGTLIVIVYVKLAYFLNAIALLFTLFITIIIIARMFLLNPLLVQPFNSQTTKQLLLSDALTPRFYFAYLSLALYIYIYIVINMKSLRHVYIYYYRETFNLLSFNS